MNPLVCHWKTPETSFYAPAVHSKEFETTLFFNREGSLETFEQQVLATSINQDFSYELCGLQPKQNYLFALSLDYEKAKS